MKAEEMQILLPWVGRVARAVKLGLGAVFPGLCEGIDVNGNVVGRLVFEGVTNMHGQCCGRSRRLRCHAWLGGHLFFLPRLTHVQELYCLT